MVIRAARESELPLISALEKSGEKQFRNGDPHVEQVSVHPDRAGHGIGAALLAAAEQLARARGHRRITLTTFRDVPWNGPYYARLGWSVVREADLTPALAAARRHERDLGFDEWPRQAMAKSL